MNDLPWVEQILPEVVWSALILDRFGNAEGPWLCEALSRAVYEQMAGREGGPRVSITRLSAISAPDRLAVLQRLRLTDELPKLQAAMGTLLRLYPECPLAWLGTGAESAGEDDVATVKRVLMQLFNKHDRQAILVQAVCVASAIRTGALRFAQGMTESARQLEFIEQYPTTEASRIAAAFVRTSCPMMVGAPLGIDHGWPLYFWNRGLQLEGCRFEGE